MWTKHRLSHYVEHIRSHLQYVWMNAEWAKGETVVTECTVTPEGWLLVEKCEAWARRYGNDMSYFVVLIEGARVIQTYQITQTEYHEFPSMPRGWTIPF